MVAAGVGVRELSPVRASLEEVFAALTRAGDPAEAAAPLDGPAVEAAGADGGAG